MIFHRFLSQQPSPSKSNTTGDPDPPFRPGLNQANRSKLPAQPNPLFDPFNPLHHRSPAPEVSLKRIVFAVALSADCRHEPVADRQAPVDQSAHATRRG